MNIYCDTSVLVAGSISAHPHYAQSAALLRQVAARKMVGVASAHSIAEFYAVITRAPITPPIYPGEAWRLLEQNILPHFRVAALSATEYKSVLRRASENGWIGGLVYDALHLAVAINNHCERIYTFDLRHFHQLAPELAQRICSP